jgi:ABC-type branched-subunit amino acid transport system ATPase component
VSRLELREVSKSFGGVVAVDRMSVGFEAGKVSALIGLNGAGKTTVFDLISGLLDPDEGDIYYGGKKISRLRPWDVAQCGIGRLFQDIKVFERLTVIENVLTAFKGQKGESAFASIFARRRVLEQERGLRERARELLHSVGLARKADEPASELSYGQQKLLALARLLAADVDALLLDEPTAGVEWRSAVKVLEVIRRLANEDKTLVIIEHNMGFISECVDTLFFVERGRVTSSGAPGVVLAGARVRAAYLGG